jgi:hypothetical protein
MIRHQRGLGLILGRHVLYTYPQPKRSGYRAKDGSIPTPPYILKGGCSCYLPSMGGSLDGVCGVRYPALRKECVGCGASVP